jgi:phosphate uptake regulator
MSKSEMTGADRFFTAAAPRSTRYELPGLGEVDLVELREAEVSEIRRRIEAEKDLTRRSKLFGMGLIVRSVHKDSTRVFTDADIDRFSDAGNSAVEKLAAAVLAINGYGMDAGDAQGN